MPPSAVADDGAEHEHHQPCETMEPYAAGDDDDEEEQAEEYEHSGLGPPSTAQDGTAGAAADDIKAVYAHVDLDAFYAMVERSLDPSLVGVPLGVVQYNPNGDLADLPVEANRRMDHSAGSLIAVSYEARARGVTRIMRGDQARAVCPEIALVQVAVKHKKADLTPYRNAGARVIKILGCTAPVERASIDEAYIDLSQPARALLASGGFGPDLIRRVREQTKLAGLEGEGARASSSGSGVGKDGGSGDDAGAAAAAPAVLTREEVRRGHVSQGQQAAAAAASDAAADAWWGRPPALWSPGERLLLCGAAVLYDMRSAVVKELGFTLSGGIAPSKLLAKLASGMNKPAQQTLVMPAMIPRLLAPLPIGRIRGLGGDFGGRLARDLQATTIGEVVDASQRRLEQLYGEATAEWLWHLVRGQDGEKVEDRAHAKSIGCGKTFYRKNLASFEQVHRWLTQLACELTERLAADAELNERVPQLVTVSFQAAGMVPVPPGQQRPQGPVRPNQPYPGNQNVSRSAPLSVSLEQLQEAPQAVQALLADTALGLVQKWQRQREETHLPSQGRLPPMRLATLFIVAGKFLEIGQKSRITSFFTNAKTSNDGGRSAAAPNAATAKAGASASPFKINIPPSSLPASAAAAPSPSASNKPSAPSQQQRGGKRKVGGGGGLEELWKWKKEASGSDAATANGGGGGGGSGGSKGLPLPAPEEVDPEVLAALPPDIRREVMAAMPQRRSCGGKKTKGQLDSYFARAGGGASGGGSGTATAGEQKPPSKPADKPKPLDRFLIKKKKG